jgi:hypothetical protein
MCTGCLRWERQSPSLILIVLGVPGLIGHREKIRVRQSLEK